MTWIAHAVQDGRFALRSWTRSPGFAAAAILTLAVGLGANTAIFSVVSATLLRPLPFADPDRLVMLSVSSPSDPRLPATYVTAGDLDLWRREAVSIERASTYTTSSQNLRGPDGPEQVATVRADRWFFGTLGIAAWRGRTFGDADPANVVVASFAFWRRHFDSDIDPIGRTLTLDGEPYTLVGIMPEGFQFPYRSATTDLWTPWAPPAAPDRRLDSVVGRLKGAADPVSTRSELSGLSARLSAGRHANVTALAEAVAAPVRRSLVVLLGAVGLVLLVACANVANLLLARATVRRREVAVRVALGAARGRLFRQFLTESLLLAVAGAVTGALIGAWSLPLLQQFAAGQLLRAAEIAFDWRVFAFLAALTVTTGVGFGLVPAFGAIRADVERDLKSGQRGNTAPRLRDALVVSEIALAFILLVGAGLLLRTLVTLRATPSGFDPEGVLTLHVVVDDATGSRALVERAARIPGVRATGFISVLPLQHVAWNGRFTIDGRSFEGTAEFRYVTPGYFDAMGIPLLAGRPLSELDTAEAPSVILVNDAFAQEFLRGEPVVGRVLTNRGTIVGVVGSVRQSSLDQPAVPEIYYPVAQNFAQLRSVGSVLVVRSALSPESLLPSVRAAIREVSPDQATFRAATMERVIDESLGGRRFYLWLIGAFAIVGTVLAAAGTYSVIAYLVTMRTREFGLRVALGADAPHIIRLVIGRGALLIALGLTVGSVGALILTRFLQALLYGVTPTDPATFLAVGLLLLVVALAACVVPARRATRVDPAAALRVE